MNMYTATLLYYDKKKGTATIKREDTNSIIEHVRILRSDGHDPVSPDRGKRVFCIGDDTDNYMLGYFTRPDEATAMNVELENGGRVISAKGGVCLYLSPAGDIGIYRMTERPDRTVGLQPVLNYNVTSDEMRILVTLFKMIFPWGTETTPNIEVSIDELMNVNYTFQGKTNVNDLSPRFKVMFRNPSLGDGSLIKIVVDKLAMPVRGVPIVAPTPIESIEINIGGNVNGQIFSIKASPLSEISLDAAGNTMIKSGVSRIEISPAGVISVKGTMFNLGSLVPGITAGFCSVPWCFLSGAPHITNKAPMSPK